MTTFDSVAALVRETLSLGDVTIRPEQLLFYDLEFTSLDLLDLGLPRMNGFEACRQIRTQPWGKNALLIAITGWGQSVDRQKSQEAGFDYHIVKPVDQQTLMSLLGEHRFRGIEA